METMTYRRSLRWIVLLSCAIFVAGCSRNSKTVAAQWSELHLAARDGRTARVEELIASGSDVNSLEPNYGVTPLHLAAGQNREETVRALLRRGANPNIRDTRFGATPLHGASHRGFYGVAKALLDAGADPNIRDSGGMTPLDRAREAKLSGLETLLEEAMGN
jgi:ankyrin repeat protein